MVLTEEGWGWIIRGGEQLPNSCTREINQNPAKRASYTPSLMRLLQRKFLDFQEMSAFGCHLTVCLSTVTYHTNMAIQHRTGRVNRQSFPKVDFSQVKLLLFVVNHTNTVPTSKYVIINYIIM